MQFCPAVWQSCSCRAWLSRDSPCLSIAGLEGHHAPVQFGTSINPHGSRRIWSHSIAIFGKRHGPRRDTRRLRARPRGGASTSSISVTAATSSSRLIPQAVLVISRWERSSCPRAQAFRFTDTLIWRRPSTSWKAVARSHSTMYVTLAKEVERFSYPRTLGMVSVVPIRNWFCCGSCCPQASTGSFAKPAAHPANRERD
jgi:hypothetical protein